MNLKNMSMELVDSVQEFYKYIKEDALNNINFNFFSHYTLKSYFDENSLHTAMMNASMKEKTAMAPKTMARMLRLSTKGDAISP